MTRRFVVVLSFALVLLAVVTGAAFAQGGDTKQIGLVIALPDNAQHLEIVTVPSAATTFDVLQKASIDLASATTQFGPAVCGINGTGCTSDNCFCDQQHFWAYYHLAAAGDKWEASQEGISAYTPADGAVEGFIWSEVDANFMPTMQPPVYTFAQIQTQSGSGGGEVLPWIILGVALVVVLVVVALAMLNRGRKRSTPAA